MDELEDVVQHRLNALEKIEQNKARVADTMTKGWSKHSSKKGIWYGSLGCRLA